VTSSDDAIATFNTTAGLAAGAATGNVTVSAKDAATGIAGSTTLNVSSATSPP